MARTTAASHARPDPLVGGIAHKGLAIPAMLRLLGFGWRNDGPAEPCGGVDRDLGRGSNEVGDEPVQLPPDIIIGGEFNDGLQILVVLLRPLFLQTENVQPNHREQNLKVLP